MDRFVLNEASITTHQMGTVLALLALCAGNSPVTGEFPSQRPVKRGFDVFFDLRLIFAYIQYKFRRICGSEPIVKSSVPVTSPRNSTNKPKVLLTETFQ